MKKITVVTPVLCPSEKVLETIKKCFLSIRKSVDKVQGEWIVVDDNSAVGSSFFSEISDTYIRNEKLEGVSKSLNEGFKISTGELLVKLDSDYFVPENLFEILLNDWSDDLGFISPSFVIGNPAKNEEFSENTLPKVEGGVVDKPNGSCSMFTYQWGGGILMFSKEAGEKIGYFDEGFGTGRGQDNDFIYRLLLEGYNWRWSNNIIVKHFQSISCNDPAAPENMSVRRKIGSDYFKQKHGFAAGGFISVIQQKFKYELNK
jgi:glycosyltransferase involved in cell wall biosynthesis